MIIPSHWRKYTSDFDARPFREEPPLLLTTPRAGHVLYGDIQDWNQLEARRTRDFPLLNTLQKVLRADDFAAFKAFESEVNVKELLRSAKRVHEKAYRRYNERWIKHNITAEMSEEPVLIEQHYGMPTMGLDLTFELSVAAFFATHQLVRTESRLADHIPVAEGEHQGVIYCFVFEDPPVVKSARLITKLELFDHCPPLRPLRQKCAFEFFHSENFNEAAVELDAMFFLKPDFDVARVPNKYELFPGPAEDSFYRALIESKRLHIDIFEPVVEYAFN